MRVFGEQIDDKDVEAVHLALDWHIAGGERFWYNWVSARAVLQEGATERFHKGASIPAIIAIRLMRRAAKDGRIVKAAGRSWKGVAHDR